MVVGVVIDDDTMHTNDNERLAALVVM